MFRSQTFTKISREALWHGVSSPCSHSSLSFRCVPSSQSTVSRADRPCRCEVVLGPDDASFDPPLGHACWWRRRAIHHTVPLAAQKVRRRADIGHLSLQQQELICIQVWPNIARMLSLYPVKHALRLQRISCDSRYVM